MYNYYVCSVYIVRLLLTLCVQVLSYVGLFVTPWTVAHQVPLENPRDSPGKNTEVNCHFLFQGIFLIQGSNLSLQRLLHGRQILYHLSLSFQFSHSVVSDSLWPHESQHARPPCPSPTPGVHSNSCPSMMDSQPSSDAIQPSHPLSSPSPPAPNPSQHQSFCQWVNSAGGGQSIGVSALASVLPMNTQDWSPLGWTGWISLQSKGIPRVFSNTTVQNHQFFGAKLSSQSNSHIHTWPLEKP